MRPRGVAAITALWFVAFGILAMQHEASTVHGRDRADGFVHASLLAGHHTGHHSDVHGERNAGADTGACALLTTFHQAGSATISAPALIAASATLDPCDTPRPAKVRAAIAVYRLAPKTSPPSAV